MMGLRRAQGPAGEIAVDLVVQAFGDGEELSVTADYQPADRDAEIADVANQYLQHLGDPAARRGRADVPDGVPGLQLPHLVRGLEQPQIALAADDGLQQGGRPPRHLHRSDQTHRICLSPYGRGRNVAHYITNTGTARNGVLV